MKILKYGVIKCKIKVNYIIKEIDAFKKTKKLK